MHMILYPEDQTKWQKVKGKSKIDLFKACFLEQTCLLLCKVCLSDFILLY